MAVTKEYTCIAHGPFEGTEARCPHGCTTAIEREFRTAPAGRSAKTKATDNALNRLAQRFGMTDISNRSGTVAGSKRQPKMEMKPEWVPMPKGDLLKVGAKGQPGVIEHRKGSAGGAEAAGKQYKTDRVADEIVANMETPLPVGQNLPRPRPVVVGRDTVTQEDFEAGIRSAA